MAPRARVVNCYGCKEPFSAEHLPTFKHCAYGQGCEPDKPSWWLDINGKRQCQCAACHDLFTTPRTFDSHQAIRDGKLICKDPRRMFRAADHLRLLVLTERGWGKNPSLENFNTFERKER